VGPRHPAARGAVMAEIHIHQQPEPDEQPLAAVLAMFPRLAEHRLVGVIRPLEAVANVSPARLCGNGLRGICSEGKRAERAMIHH